MKVWQKIKQVWGFLAGFAIALAGLSQPGTAAITQDGMDGHGIEPKSFKVSDRALGRPVQTQGANKGRTVDIETMMQDYWTQFGWDPDTGKPLAETIKELEAGL